MGVAMHERLAVSAWAGVWGKAAEYGPAGVFAATPTPGARTGESFTGAFAFPSSPPQGGGELSAVTLAHVVPE